MKEPSLPFLVSGAARSGTMPRWLHYGAQFPSLAFQFADRGNSAIRFLAGAMDAGASHALVSLDSLILLPTGFPGMARRAIEHADGLVDRWALLAAGGLTSSLEPLDYGYYAASPDLTYGRDLTPCLAPYPQLQLFNLQVLRETIGDLRAIPETERCDFLVMLAALKGGAASFVSPFLRFGRRAAPDAVPLPLSARTREFLATRFGGDVHEAEGDPLAVFRSLGSNDRATLALFSDGEQRADLAAALMLNGVSQAVRVATRTGRPEARVSVAVRTVLSRPSLVRRLMSSLSIAAVAGPLHEVILISDLSAELLAVVNVLREEYPSLPLTACEVKPGPIPSRTANLLGGLRRATGDYVWFVDDDDMVMPNAFSEIQAAVTSRHHPVLVADSAVYDEVWLRGSGGRDVLESSRLDSTFDARRWTRVFGGVNPLPICSVVYPRELVAGIATDEVMRDDLSEDFGLLLSTLGDPQADVRRVPAVIAGVSRRGGKGSDRAMAMEDREPWVAGIAGFIADILSPDSGYSVPLVDLGKRVAVLMRENDRLRSQLEQETKRAKKAQAALKARTSKREAALSLSDNVARLTAERRRSLPVGEVPASVARQARKRSRLRRFLGRVKRRISRLRS